MYLKHFQLKAAPFAITPDPRYFYEGGKYKQLLTVLQDRLVQGSLCTLTGVKGVGKSTVIMQLCRCLGRKYKIVRINRPDMTTENLLNYIVLELGLADSLLEQAAAELRIHDWLLQDDAGNRLIIIIDNADKTPLSSRQALVAIHAKPIATGNLFSVLLSGSTALQSLLDGSSSFGAGYTLPRLSNKEVGEYLNFRATEVGCYPQGRLFDRAVSNRIAQLSNGIPRNIHLLADKVLCAAFNMNAPVPTVDMLSETPHLEEDAATNTATHKPGREWLLALVCVAVAVLLYYVGASSDSPKQAAPQVVHQPLAEQQAVPEVAAAVFVDEGLELEASYTQEALDAADSSLDADSLVEGEVVEEAESPTTMGSALANSQGRLQFWLDSAPSSAGTIQLLLVQGGEASRINEYLEQLGDSLDSDQLMTYSTVRQGKAFYGVLYQQHPSRAVAAEHLQNLPSEIQKLGPFLVRSAAGVANEQNQI